MLFRSLFDRESCTYTYLLADQKTREAVLIDTVLECHKRDWQQLQELELKLLYLLETHIHADHVTGAGLLKEKTGADFCVSKASMHTQADKLLVEGDTLVFGANRLKVLSTPGHTDTCLTYFCPQAPHSQNTDELEGPPSGYLFTGDTLFVRGCGRTDFQGGDAKQLYQSVHKKIYKYSDDTRIYPGHDYNGCMVSTVGEEKRFNPRLTKTLPEFVSLMNNLNLPPPVKMHMAVKQNKNCLT